MRSFQISLPVTWADFDTVKDICMNFAMPPKLCLIFTHFYIKRYWKSIWWVGELVQHFKKCLGESKEKKKKDKKNSQLVVGIWDLHFKWSGPNFSPLSSLLSHLPCPLSSPSVMLTRVLPLLLPRFGSSINLFVSIENYLDPEFWHWDKSYLTKKQEDAGKWHFGDPDQGVIV